MNYRSREGDSGQASSGLRILCLHDANSNATKLSNKLEELGERLYEKHAIDLVYINSPLTNGAAASETEEPDRVWWEETEDGKFEGLDASLLLLRQVWNSMPFWGILAVGQGVTAALFLPLLPVDPMPAFGIFVHGESILEEEERLIEHFPCLHVVGANPAAAAPSEKLIKQFGGEVHQGGKNFTKATMNAIGKFLLEQKKELRVDGSGTVLALQNQLYLAEQEAADAVARQIAADPPKALMAVISPQNVGGWHGARRREFGEEGGGAPCPPEFLLKREKRPDADGPSRVHPTAAVAKEDDKKEEASAEDTA